MKKRYMFKKEFLNKLDSVWGNWYICPRLLREFSAFVCFLGGGVNVVFARDLLTSPFNKKFCYGRGTARRACQYRKMLSIDEWLWHTPKVITVAAIEWPYGISLPACGLLFQRLYLGPFSRHYHFWSKNAFICNPKKNVFSNIDRLLSTTGMSATHVWVAKTDRHAVTEIELIQSRVGSVSNAPNRYKRN